MELYFYSPSMPSWHGAQLMHRDNFYFYFTDSVLIYVFVYTYTIKADMIFSI